jgi:hypothetical protein
MVKRLIRYAIILGLAVIIALLLKDRWLPSLKNIFKARPVVIENTPILIKEIHELAQLCTVTAFDEVVADSVEIREKSTLESLLPDMSGFAGLPVTGKRLVIIGRGKIVAGTDLKNLNDQSIYAEGDSVAMVLPAAEILDAIMNPSDIETFSEVGEWSSDAVMKVKIKARNMMIARALKQGILQKADARSKMLMENFLRSAGFTKVNVLVKEREKK